MSDVVTPVEAVPAKASGITPQDIEMLKHYNGQLKKAFAPDEYDALLNGTATKDQLYWFERYKDHHMRTLERQKAERDRFLRSPVPMGMFEQLVNEFKQLNHHAGLLKREVDVLYNILRDNKNLFTQEEIDIAAEMRDAKKIGNKCETCAQVRPDCGEEPEEIQKYYKKIVDEDVKKWVVSCKGYTHKSVGPTVDNPQAIAEAKKGLILGPNGQPVR